MASFNERLKKLERTNDTTDYRYSFACNVIVDDDIRPEELMRLRAENPDRRYYKFAEFADICI